MRHFAVRCNGAAIGNFLMMIDAAIGSFLMMNFDLRIALRASATRRDAADCLITVIAVDGTVRRCGRDKRHRVPPDAAALKREMAASAAALFTNLRSATVEC